MKEEQLYIVRSKFTDGLVFAWTLDMAQEGGYQIIAGPLPTREALTLKRLINGCDDDGEE